MFGEDGINMESYKKQKITLGFSFTLLFLIVLFLLYVTSVNTRNLDNFITDEQFVELGLKISFLPPESKPSIEFFRLSKDDKLTKSDSQEIEKLIHSYLQEMNLNHKKIDTSKMTDLEKARANLAAFNEVGYLIVPPEKMNDVRDEMMKNIKRLEESEIKDNK